MILINEPFYTKSGYMGCFQSLYVVYLPMRRKEFAGEETCSLLKKKINAWGIEKCQRAIYNNASVLHKRRSHSAKVTGRIEKWIQHKRSYQSNSRLQTKSLHQTGIIYAERLDTIFLLTSAYISVLSKFWNFYISPRQPTFITDN